MHCCLTRVSMKTCDANVFALRQIPALRVEKFMSNLFTSLQSGELLLLWSWSVALNNWICLLCAVTIQDQLNGSVFYEAMPVEHNDNIERVKICLAMEIIGTRERGCRKTQWDLCQGRYRVLACRRRMLRIRVTGGWETWGTGKQRFFCKMVIKIEWVSLHLNNHSLWKHYWELCTVRKETTIHR